MKDIILSLFGAYEPVTTQTVVTTVSDGVTTTDIVDTVVSGASGLDWPWIAGVFLFALVLWSFFRCVGVLLQR